MNAQSPYPPRVAARTVGLQDRLAAWVTPLEWPLMAPTIDAIQRLKEERNAVLLAHNYMKPEIFHAVADITGDSLALARKGAETEAEVIVMAGVHFMAETAKILSPEKTVLMPDLRAGCSLAESITAADVRALKDRHPGLPVIAYVNTSAEVKAEVDICCTSGNAVAVVEAAAAQWGVDTVIMVPDKYLAENVAAQTAITVIAYDGACEVHEMYTPEDVESIRDSYDGDITVIAHPECPRPVVEAADFAGSTAQMADFVRDRKPSRVLLVTECSMGDNLMAAHPGTEFVRACNLCPHMKRITLDNIRAALETLTPAITVDPAIAARARLSVERMLAVGRNGTIA
jgi:quinolinate synthase